MLSCGKEEGAVVDNNDILRRVRYIINGDDKEMTEVLALGGYTMSTEDMANLLARDDEPGFLPCRDEVLVRFLDGLILKRRGPSDKPAPRNLSIIPDNNLVLKKLRIAFNLQEEAMLDTFHKAGFDITKSELSAFFRKRGSRQYRACGDQALRRFLKGLSIKD